MDNRRTISFVIVMTSLDPVSLAWQQRAASRYSKRPAMRHGPMRFVNGFWGVCGESGLITFSSSRRSSCIVSFRPMCSTSIKPDRIKASNNRSQNSMVSLFLRITMLARFSPSRSWVDYTTITAAVLELLRVCEEADGYVVWSAPIWEVAYTQAPSCRFSQIAGCDQWPWCSSSFFCLLFTVSAYMYASWRTTYYRKMWSSG